MQRSNLLFNKRNHLKQVVSYYNNYKVVCVLIFCNVFFNFLLSFRNFALNL